MSLICRRFGGLEHGTAAVEAASSGGERHPHRTRTGEVTRHCMSVVYDVESESEDGVCESSAARQRRAVVRAQGRGGWLRRCWEEGEGDSQLSVAGALPAHRFARLLALLLPAPPPPPPPPPPAAAEVEAATQRHTAKEQKVSVDAREHGSRATCETSGVVCTSVSLGSALGRSSLAFACPCSGAPTGGVSPAPLHRLTGSVVLCPCCCCALLGRRSVHHRSAGIFQCARAVDGHPAHLALLQPRQLPLQQTNLRHGRAQSNRGRLASRAQILQHTQHRQPQRSAAVAVLCRVDGCGCGCVAVVCGGV